VTEGTTRLGPTDLHGPWLLLLILAVVAGRAFFSCVVLPASGAGLGDTEAYYTAWAMDLQWGYHDHPGGVAWAIALVRLVLPGLWATRGMAALALAGTLTALAAFWRRQAGASGAIWGVILFAAIPIFGTGGLLAAPDAPLAVGWAVALLAVDRGLRAPGRSVVWWLVAGLACAWMLASKWIGGILMASLAAEIVWHHRGAWAGWRRGAAVFAMGLCGLGPTVAFEGAHDASGLRYHLLERHSGVAFAPENWLTFVGGQLLVLSPVLAVLIAVGVAKRVGSARGEGLEVWRVGLMAWVPLAAMCVFTREAEPHWAVMAYLPLLGSLGLWAAARAPRVLRAGVLLGVVVQTVLWLHLATPLFMPFVSDGYEPRYDLANDLRGWRELAPTLRRELASGRVDRVVGYHYTVCGQLVAALDDLDAVVCASRRRDAFDFLRGGASGRPEEGSDLLYVRDNRYDEPGPQRLRCDAWDAERWSEVRRAGRVVHRFGLQRCRGYRGMVPAQTSALGDGGARPDGLLWSGVDPAPGRGERSP